MRIIETPIAGVLILEAEPHVDDRGYFARIYDRELLAKHGLSFTLRESSTSYNRKRGTLRGLHYQIPPAAETKLVRCTRGAIFDVVVDLRPESPSFRRWNAAELTADNLRTLAVPTGCAHGFITLADETEISYHIDAPFTHELSRGVRWNDPAFAITWPIEPTVISARDASYPDVSHSDA